jgi:O-antigen ligase
MAAITLIGSAILLIGTLFVLGPQISGQFIAQATLRDFELSSESIFGRLRSFGQAIEVWRGSPLFGVGLGGFGPATGGEISTGYAIVNNQFLETLAETGLVGLIVFMLLILSIVAVFLKIISKINFLQGNQQFLPNLLVGLVAAFGAIFAQYNFFSTFAIIHIWVLVGLIVALESIILHELKK